MDSGWLRKSTYDDSVTSSSWGQVTPLPFFGADDELLEALHKGHPGAGRAFYDRYADVVDRILSRVIGPDDDHPELIEQTFLRALAAIGGVRDSARLSGFVTAMAVRTARGHLARQTSGRLWGLLPGRRARRALDGGPSRPSDALTRAMHALYAVLDELPVDERIALSLRLIDAMPPAEIAEVSGVSVRRLRRRLRRAEARFVSAARRSPVLRPWVDRATRWSLPTLG
jgi:RNA polymerase sigma-70 factor, ECF subfamily